MQRLVDERLRGENDAAEAATLPVDMLRRRIDDNVGAELEGLLQERRREDIVDDEPRARLMREIGDGFEVVDLEAGIGRRLEEKGLGLLADGLLPLREVGAVDERRLDAEARQQILDDVETGAEKRPRRDDVIAGLDLRKHGGGDGGHAGGGGARGFRALEQAHARLEHGHGRIGEARIDEARIVALETRLGSLGGGIGEALREVERLGQLAEG